jgi:hypothetical protein
VEGAWVLSLADGHSLTPATITERQLNRLLRDWSSLLRKEWGRGEEGGEPEVALGSM